MLDISSSNRKYRLLKLSLTAINSETKGISHETQNVQAELCRSIMKMRERPCYDMRTKPCPRNPPPHTNHKICLSHRQSVLCFCSELITLSNLFQCSSFQWRGREVGLHSSCRPTFIAAEFKSYQFCDHIISMYHYVLTIFQYRFKSSNRSKVF